jgi:replicative DNA helicase
LSSLEGPFNKEELISNTERFLKERFIYKTILNVAEKFTDQSFSIEETLVDFEKAYNITLKENLGHWYLEDVEKHIKDLTTIYNPVPTGWEFFDSKTEGGLFPKTLTVFAGQVNVGKSIVLGNLATNMLLADKNVLLISLEMSEFMYSKRISTQLTQIPHNDLKTFTGELQEQLRHIKRSINSKLVIKEYPPKSITVRQIDGFVTKLKHKGFNPDIIVIDYINLIHPIAKNLNSYESVKEIAEHLRALAFKYNIPIISATQLNRGSFNTSSPGMEGIAESIGLAATCDVICSLWQEEEDRELGVINMGMQKNRFGPNFGHAAFKCNYNTLTLKETSTDYFADESSTEDIVKGAENTLNDLIAHDQ